MKPSNFANSSPFGNVSDDKNSSKNDINRLESCKFHRPFVTLSSHSPAHWRSATAAELYCFKPIASNYVLQESSCRLQELEVVVLLVY